MRKSFLLVKVIICTAEERNNSGEKSNLKLCYNGMNFGISLQYFLFLNFLVFITSDVVREALFVERHPLLNASNSDYVFQ